VVGEQQGTAVAKVRGFRLLAAATRDERAAFDQILDELEGCRLCLEAMVTFGFFVAGGMATTVAHGNKALAIQQAEKRLKQSVDEAQRQM
jgi:hypothetical protein